MDPAYPMQEQRTNRYRETKMYCLLYSTVNAQYKPIFIQEILTNAVNFLFIVNDIMLTTQRCW